MKNTTMYDISECICMQILSMHDVQHLIYPNKTHLVISLCNNETLHNMVYQEGKGENDINLGISWVHKPFSTRYHTALVNVWNYKQVNMTTECTVEKPGKTNLQLLICQCLKLRTVVIHMEDILHMEDTLKPEYCAVSLISKWRKFLSNIVFLTSFP